MGNQQLTIERASNHGDQRDQTRTSSRRGELPALVIDIDFEEVRPASFFRDVREFWLELLEGVLIGFFILLGLSIIVMVVSLT